MGLVGQAMGCHEFGFGWIRDFWLIWVAGLRCGGSRRWCGWWVCGGGCHGFLIQRKRWETFEFLDLMILFGFENFVGFGLFFLWVSDPIFFVFVSQEDLWV